MENTDATEIKETWLSRLQAVDDDKILLVGIRRYLATATVAGIFDRQPQTVSRWCRAGKVFNPSHVKRVPELYNQGYLIPVDEVERVIDDGDVPRPGNPGRKGSTGYWTRPKADEAPESQE